MAVNLLTQRLQIRKEERNAEEQRLKEQQKINEEQDEVTRLHGVATNYIRANDYRKVREIYSKIVSLRPNDSKALWGICECDKKLEKDPVRLFVELDSFENFVKDADDPEFLIEKVEYAKLEYDDELSDQKKKRTSRCNELQISKDNLQKLNDSFGGLKAPHKAKRIVAAITLVLLAVALIIAKYSLLLEEVIDNTIFFSLVVMVSWMAAFIVPFLFYYFGSTKIDDERDDYQRQIGYMTSVVDADKDKVKMVEERIAALENRMEEISSLYLAREDDRLAS